MKLDYLKWPKHVKFYSETPLGQETNVYGIWRNELEKLVDTRHKTQEIIFTEKLQIIFLFISICSVYFIIQKLFPLNNNQLYKFIWETKIVFY